MNQLDFWVDQAEQTLAKNQWSWFLARVVGWGCGLDFQRLFK